MGVQYLVATSALDAWPRQPRTEPTPPRHPAPRITTPLVLQVLHDEPALHSDSFAKEAVIGSADQRNINWATVGLEGDRHCTDGVSWLIHGSEGGTQAAIETGALLERARAGSRQTGWIDPRDGLLERKIRAPASAVVLVRVDLGGTQRDFSRPGIGAIDPADRRVAGTSAVDHQSKNIPLWWAHRHRASKADVQTWD